MTDSIILTRDGLAKLKDELTDLKKIRRPQIAERIRAAKEYGDLSENAEYHEAKEEQGFVEGRIMEIEHILKVAVIAEPNHSKVANVGSTVELDKDGSSVSFRIVGATEADPANGRISLESPLGQALLGKSEGDAVSLATPGGTIQYTLKKIQ